MFAIRCRTAARALRVGSQVRTVMTLKDVKYTAHATARGQGRNGEVKSDDDDGLTLRLAMPRSLGGKGDGQNPEQLFAMGYSACFLSALQLVAGRRGEEAKRQAKNAVVRARVHMGEPQDLGGFGLAVDIEVEGVQDEELIQAGHEACPYSRALKHGAVVNVSKA
ncbi:OsmC-like protein [Heliocybe sulcata]|uniref:OsmC-like protein n=1 Tax=Heliocybe sulcata TaxID=5364 RepID=A0A5C3NBA1_9AGAM|nr:OsmC-like protein [Heliocybe sulcata]